MLGGLPVFLPSGQLSGLPCRTQVLVIRDFTTTCIHAQVSTMRLYASLAYLSVCGCTHQPAQLHLSSSCCYSRQPYQRGFKVFGITQKKSPVSVHRSASKSVTRFFVVANREIHDVYAGLREASQITVDFFFALTRTPIFIV